MSRQNFYQQRQRRAREAVDEELVLTLVRQLRRRHPRLGCRKLRVLLRCELQDAGIQIGRDKLFSLLRRHGLLLTPLKSAPKTTNARHSLPVFHNLAAACRPTAAHELWVSDITYIATDEGFVYLALIMDRYSRKIVGYHCRDNLETQGSLQALAMAIAQLPAGAQPIHHSDRGSQYCCHAYVQQLQAYGLPISMTEILHCYENAHAERLNGILKQEYGLGQGEVLPIVWTGMGEI